MTARVEPIGELSAVRFERLQRVSAHGVAVVTNLPSHIPHRMARRAHNLLSDAGLSPHIRPIRERGAGPGAGISLWLEQGGASALGRKGLPADKVAEIAVAELLSFVDNDTAVDHHLADQLLLPMVLAKGESGFTTNCLTRHTLTNADLLRHWLDVTIKVEGILNGPGRISVKGIHHHAGEVA